MDTKKKEPSGLKKAKSRKPKKIHEPLKQSLGKNKDTITIVIAAISLIVSVINYVATIITDNTVYFIVAALFTFVGGLCIYFVLRSKEKKAKESEEVIENTGTKEKDESLPLIFKSILLFVIGGMLIFLIYYLFLPVVSLQSPGFIFFIAVVLLFIATLIVYIIIEIKKKNKKKKILFTKLEGTVSLSLIGTILVFTLIGWLSGAEFFCAKSYSNLVTIEHIKDQEELNKTFDYVSGEISLPNIDKELSYRQAQIALSNYGNQYHINEKYMSLQNIKIDGKDKLIRVAPLEYSNVFVSLQENDIGTPGYVLVDVTTSEATLHTDNKLVYMPTAKFSKDLLRHIRLNNISMFFDNYYFEIDDDYNPYWVIPYYSKTIGLFGGKKPKGVMTVNAVTGKINKYDIPSAPTWIDNVVDRDICEQLASYALKYSKGFINSSIGSKEDVYQLNDGYNYFVKNGDAYYVSSVTSKDERDATSIGFLTINLSTGATKLYYHDGITEGRAMNISMLDDSVKAMNLSATWPVFITINGTPTYYLTLKNEIKTQKYIFLDQADGEKMVIGDSMEEAYKKYVEIINKVPSALKEVSGTIERVNIVEENIYFKLTGNENVYSAKLSLNKNLVILKSGDNITFKAYENVNSISEVYSVEEIVLN